MKGRVWTAVLAGAAALGASAPALSHHSHAMFDHTRDVTITGTVSNFVFTNPHAFLYVDVRQENGATVKYWIEMTNIPNMLRSGIRATTFKPGDAITVTIRPLTDGKPGGNYKKIVAADGSIYTYGE